MSSPPILVSNGKARQHIVRPDGSEVQIVAQYCYGPTEKPAVDTFVLGRASSSEAWRVLNNRPHPDWRTMSVAEYVQHGRSEMLQRVTHGEIFKVFNALRASAR